MPPAAARDIFIILVDLKSSPRDDVLHTLSTVILYKQLSASKSEYNLYLVNAADSSNKLKYTGIYKWEIPDAIEDLCQEISSIETGQSDWLEALALAVDDLSEKFEKPGVITLQVLFITDLCSFERPDNGKLMEKLINDCKQMDIFLYVIGLPIEPPKTIFSHKDVSEWMAKLQIDKDQSNLKIMKKIVNKTPHSVMCNFEVGFHLFHSYKYFKGMQPWKVPLTCGSKLNLPVSTIRVSKRDPPFSLKNLSAKVDLKWAFEDEQDKIIDSVDTVSGLIKHGKFIKIESDGRFKIVGPRSFQVLGFTKAVNVPEYFLQSDGSYLVLPDCEQPEEYLKFFNALIEELAESKVYIIARRVYNADCNPKFSALIPWNEFNLKGFILCQLPYADDVVNIYVEEDVDLAPELNPDEKCFEFLDKINVGSDKCKLQVPLSPTMMVYSNAINIIAKVEEKLMHSNRCTAAESYTSELPFQDDFQNNWPQRNVDDPKKEKVGKADFEDVDDFNFD
ncbi:uncharacterized protein LOC109545143 [Dendroctonus ponderosae]|nr:uncharacterized protein LOC109545143 [Dendroctonus ponderosae]KAH1015402.1 hypothetical protein HUJ05_013131 [Dendroctonus ponderosae]KAH1015403.1 hypothetical protein HUJ05_013131 [Dendroctonus ponderosae]